MYNRYVPQPDGSYRRNQVPVPSQPVKEPRRTEKQEKPEAHPAEATKEDQKIFVPQSVSAGSFLRQLIPKGLDTGDLLVIVLLLLMAGDCQDEKNTALLTLALYLFL